MRIIIFCILLLYMTKVEIISAFTVEQISPNAKNEDAGRLCVFDDNGIIGSLGTFHGSEDMIELETISLPEQAPEGSKMLMIRSQINPGGWAGLFFKPGLMEEDKVIDVSRYAEEGELRFWISSTRDVLGILLRAQSVLSSG